MAKAKLTIETYRSPSNKLWYWRLKSRNGAVVAVGGEGYETRTGLVRALKRLATWAIPSNWDGLEERLNFSPIEAALHAGVKEITSDGFQ